jgi:hypothetical protein
LTLDVKKSNSSNETPNVMSVGVEKYGLGPIAATSYCGNKVHMIRAIGPNHLGLVATIAKVEQLW